jgi:hypothetical protein
MGAWLLGATLALVVVGCALYVGGHIGWAQMWWVLASGTAGGAVAVFVDKQGDE